MAATSTHAGSRGGRLLRALAAAMVVVALALLALLHGRDRFEGSVVNASGEKVYVAREGDPVQLRFVDRGQAGTAYRAIVTTSLRTYAIGGRTGKRGAASRLTAPDAGLPSRVSVRWMVGGRTAARWVFLVRPRKRTT